jgi:PAS domain S-box-containing protein
MTRQKELLDTTFACIGEGVIVTDVWQRVTLINPAAAHLSGWKAEEALGQAISTVFRALHSATGKPMENPVEKALRAGFFAKPDDSPLLITKTGATLPIDVSAWVIQPPDGSLFGMVLVFRDRSEQRRAAETLARGREELEKLAQERTSQLQDMVTELQHVSYSITHDMRAPLRAMSAFAEMLMDQTSSRPSVEETQDYCRRIIRAARRLDQLIVDALHYTKVVLQEVPLQPVNLTKILSDLIEVYPHLHRDRADIEIENDLPIVVGNESYLTQCFSNLLSNAVKFVEPGVRPRIRIHAQNTEGHTRIWVEDNGIGIPLAAQKRLFGMYEKLNNKYEGTGIGLAVVRKVAERMGGTVGAESAPGQGSKFWVELSLAAWGQDLIPRRSRRSEILSR